MFLSFGFSLHNLCPTFLQGNSSYPDTFLHSCKVFLYCIFCKNSIFSTTWKYSKLVIWGDQYRCSVYAINIKLLSPWEKSAFLALFNQWKKVTSKTHHEHLICHLLLMSSHKCDITTQPVQTKGGDSVWSKSRITSHKTAFCFYMKFFMEIFFFLIKVLISELHRSWKADFTNLGQTQDRLFLVFCLCAKLS